MRPGLAVILCAGIIAACAEGDAVERPAFTPPPGAVWETGDGCDEALYASYVDTRIEAAFLRAPISLEEADARWSRWASAAEATRTSPHVDDATVNRVLETIELGRRNLSSSWSGDGSALLGGLDGQQSVFRIVFPDGSTLSDGTPLSGTDFTAVIIGPERSLFEACTMPPAGWTELIEDDSMPLPRGRLLMVELEDWRSPTVIGLPDAEPLTWTGGPASGAFSSPDHTRLYFVRDGDIWASAADGTDALRVGAHETCWGWGLDSESFVVTRLDGGVSRFDLATSTTVALGVAARETCAVDAGEGRYATTDLADAGSMELWLADVESGTDQRLLSAENCTLIVDAPYPVPGIVSVIARCADRYQDGVWLVDVETGAVEHAVSGSVGVVPSYSPDGRWVAVIRNLGPREDFTPSVWIIDLETDRGRRMSRDGFSFPALVLDRSGDPT